jgi:alpha-aminoadipic semialdehyde synthase
VHTDEFREKMDELQENDILFHSVDHLPAEMPKEASNHFGSQLLQFVERVVKSDFSKPFEEQDDLPEEIKNACITAHGQLTPDFAYISKLREANELIAAKSDKGDSESLGLQGFTIMLTGHLFDT